MMLLLESEIDTIAKALCAVRGQDPNRVEGYNGHNPHTANLPLWQIVRPEVVSYLEMREAIRRVGLTLL